MGPASTFPHLETPKSESLSLLPPQILKETLAHSRNCYVSWKKIKWWVRAPARCFGGQSPATASWPWQVPRHQSIRPELESTLSFLTAPNSPRNDDQQPAARSASPAPSAELFPICIASPRNKTERQRPERTQKPHPLHRLGWTSHNFFTPPPPATFPTTTLCPRTFPRLQKNLKPFFFFLIEKFPTLPLPPIPAGLRFICRVHPC